jgi:lysozyme family protein
MDGYSSALQLLLKLEGGYALTSPPEGPTFAGILQATWHVYLTQKGQPYHWPPTPEEVGSFYNEVWMERFCDEMPDPVGVAALQMLVNLPFDAGNRVLQCALEVIPDGEIGPVTKRAFLDSGPAIDLAERILVAQSAHYCATPDNPNFTGLMNRVEIVREFLNAMGDE